MQTKTPEAMHVIAERKYYTPAQASDFLTSMGLPTPRSTLDTMVSRGGGPRYFKWGFRRIYAEADLLAWIDERCGAPRRSSSEAR